MKKAWHKPVFFRARQVASRFRQVHRVEDNLDSHRRVSCIRRVRFTPRGRPTFGWRTRGLKPTLRIRLPGTSRAFSGRDKSLHAFDKYTVLKTTWIRIDG